MVEQKVTFDDPVNFTSLTAMAWSPSGQHLAVIFSDQNALVFVDVDSHIDDDRSFLGIDGVVEQNSAFLDWEPSGEKIITSPRCSPTHFQCSLVEAGSGSVERRVSDRTVFVDTAARSPAGSELAACLSLRT